MVAGGWEGLDFVRSLAQEKSPPDFLLSGGNSCVDGDAMCGSLCATEVVLVVSERELGRVDSLGREGEELEFRSWYIAKMEDFGGGRGRP